MKIYRLPVTGWIALVMAVTLLVTLLAVALYRQPKLPTTRQAPMSTEVGSLVQTVAKAPTVEELPGKPQPKPAKPADKAPPVVKLPDKFRAFRVVVEIKPDIPMTAEKIFESVQKICDMVASSPAVDSIKALAVAGSCEEDGKVVFRVLKPKTKETQ